MSKRIKKGQERRIETSQFGRKINVKIVIKCGEKHVVSL